MSRSVDFYKMSIDKRYIDKTSGMAKQGNTLNTVHFIDDTELVNPVMKLSSFDASQVNYVYIPSLNRYYYVGGVTYSKGYYYINLHVDVLMSFKNSILNMPIIASRNSSHYDKFMHDDRMKTEQFTHDVYKGFKGGNAFSGTANTFLLAVMGSGENEENEQGGE